MRKRGILKTGILNDALSANIENSRGSSLETGLEEVNNTPMSPIRLYVLTSLSKHKV